MGDRANQKRGCKWLALFVLQPYSQNFSCTSAAVNFQKNPALRYRTAGFYYNNPMWKGEYDAAIAETKTIRAGCWDFIAH